MKEEPQCVRVDSQNPRRLKIPFSIVQSSHSDKLDQVCVWWSLYCGSETVSSTGLSLFLSVSLSVSLFLPSSSLSRKAKECRWLWAGAAFWGVQCAERKAGTAGEPLVQAPGHPVWNLSHCLLCETRPHWQDAHPPSHRRKGTFSRVTGYF